MYSRSNIVAKKLYDSPVFAGSLGSKELFHSNIWAYLIEQDNRFLSVFFEDYNGEDIIPDPETGANARREQYHIDLLVVTNTKVYVIENKIKSIPYKEQLKNYKEKIKNEYKKLEPHFLLTGISDHKPSFLNEVKDWKYLSYNVISEGIRNINNSPSDKEDKKPYYSFVQEYADVIKNISSLLKEGIDGIGNQFYFPQFKEENIYKSISTISDIKNLRLGDIFQKINAEHFVQQVEEDYIPKEPFIELPICKSGFTRQYSLAEFYYEKKRTLKIDDSNKDFLEYVRVGVQIQETQFRWYIETRTKEGKSINDVFNIGSENNIWFDKEPDLKPKRKIKTPIQTIRDSSMRDIKCKFQTTTNTYVYQYYNIEPKMCGFEYLAKEVVEFMKKAEVLIEPLETKFLI